LLLGDEETIGGASPTPVLSLISMLDAGVSEEIDVLSEENASSYWQRSDQFDLALDLSGGTRGPAALAEAVTRWISHLLGIDVRIEPLTAVRDARLTCYIGLVAEAPGIGAQLWHGETLDARTRAGLLSLSRLTSADASLVGDKIAREPIYLILAMTSDQLVRMKPQNLLTG